MLPATPSRHAERKSACVFATVVATPSVSAASGSWRIADSAYPKREILIHAASATETAHSASAAKYCTTSGGAAASVSPDAPAGKRGPVERDQPVASPIPIVAIEKYGPRRRKAGIPITSENAPAAAAPTGTAIPE